jgi:hypothetical protein
MIERWGRASAFAAVALAAAFWTGAADAEINAHRALYTMTLGTSRTDSGVTGARGAMAYQWGESCDGWTVEQRYKLTLSYAESQDVVIVSNFVTWESKDGLRYRFNQKETRNGTIDQEIRGEAQLDGPGKGGTITFDKPSPKTLKIPAGAMFPSAHTILLLEKAQAGENFVSRQVFDGATVDGAVLVTGAIGGKVEPDPKDPMKAPILQRAGWRVRLAFFPADLTEEKPDYELGMLLLENGVSRDMLIDYGDYTIKAKLDNIEAMPKPNC